MQHVIIHETILEALVDERRRLGIDKRDEVWDGVVHMVPSASRVHIFIQQRLEIALGSIARRRQLVVFRDFDLMDPAKGEKDYRQPDLCVVDLARTTPRAIQPGAHVAIEIVSPNDESRNKLSFYAKQQVGEVWLIDPRTMTIEVYAGTTPIVAQDGVVRADALGLELQIIGDALVIRDGADEYSIDLRDVP